MFLRPCLHRWCSVQLFLLTMHGTVLLLFVSWVIAADDHGNSFSERPTPKRNSATLRLLSKTYVRMNRHLPVVAHMGDCPGTVLLRQSGEVVVYNCRLCKVVGRYFESGASTQRPVYSGGLGFWATYTLCPDEREWCGTKSVLRNVKPWTLEFFRTSMAPLLINGRLFITSHNGNLAAIEMADGRRIWFSHVEGPIRHSPFLFSPGMIGILSLNGTVNLRDEDTGKILSTIPVKNPRRCSG